MKVVCSGLSATLLGIIYCSHPFVLCSWRSELGSVVLMMGLDSRRFRNRELWQAGQVISTFIGLPGRQ
jgi:hypothetical protein